MSLVQIESPPAAENAVIHLHATDNVAIARVMLPAGQVVRIGDLEIRATQMIPAGHKIALREIAAGERVMRYGCRIGKASREIHPGEHVHTGNLAFEEAPDEFEVPIRDIPISAPPKALPTSLG